MVTFIADIGNTSLKLACFNDRRLLKAVRVRADREDEIEEAFLKLVSFNPGIAFLGSVNGNNHWLELSLKRAKIPLKPISVKGNLPIKNQYNSRETLGIDRISNAIAASRIFPHNPIVIVDTGTCIKFDFINENNEYLGGSISPGIEMRYKALHTFTGGLPLLGLSEDIYLIGKNTHESINAGVINGAIAEVNGVLEQYLMAYKNLKIITTGGDQLMFERNIKFSFQSEPWLTLKGLNEIQIFHKEN